MISLLIVAACEGPTLWIGAAAPDAESVATSPATPPPPSDRPDAATRIADAEPPANPPLVPRTDGGVTTQLQPTGPRDNPRDPEDAGTTLDAGSTGPITVPVDPIWDPSWPTSIPAPKSPCPEIRGSGTYRFGDPNGRNLMVDIHVAPDAKQKPRPGGPLVLYYHAVGDTASEVREGFGQPAIDAVVAQGGIVAAFNAKLCPSCGFIAEDAVWYEEDDAVTDHVVACAIVAAQIDYPHIHALGFSAGALYSIHLAVVRANYIASVVSYSGGMLDEVVPDQPANKVAAVLTYGRAGLDTIILDFADMSVAWYEATRTRGYYSMLCDHGGGHAIPADLVPHVLQFFRDHPYRVAPEPYSHAIPMGWPSYCSNTPPM